MNQPRPKGPNYQGWFPAILAIILFGLSMWAIRQELRQHSITEIWSNLRSIPAESISLAIVATLFNYLALTGYDTLAARYVKQPLAYRQTALVAIISYAISNTVGLALLSGSAIRYRFYSTWGVPISKIAQIIAFCNVSFWLGLCAVGGILFIFEPIAVPKLLKLPFSSVHPLGIIFLIIVSAYLFWSVLSSGSLRVGSLTIPHLPLQLSIAQILITSLDWALAASVLYILLPSSAPLSYAGFFGIYLLAQIAGITSNVPGGLGVFETVILILISPPVPADELFGALLAYRGIYYFLPFAIAVLILGGYELYQRLTIKS